MLARRITLGIAALGLLVLHGPAVGAEKGPKKEVRRPQKVASDWQDPLGPPGVAPPGEHDLTPAPLSDAIAPDGAGVPLGAGPPPGTVGRTYRMPTRKVPIDKHPRTAMLSVFDSNASDMFVEGMKGYRDLDGVWVFETKEPVIPGIPHIYHVKAKMGEEPDAPIQWRTVRLIPGRIIDLDW